MDIDNHIPIANYIFVTITAGVLAYVTAMSENVDETDEIPPEYADNQEDSDISDDIQPADDENQNQNQNENENESDNNNSFVSSFGAATTGFFAGLGATNKEEKEEEKEEKEEKDDSIESSFSSFSSFSSSFSSLFVAPNPAKKPVVAAPKDDTKLLLLSLSFSFSF